MEEVEVEIADITEANLADIPQPCRGCVYWEFPNELKKGKEERKSEFERKKREWFVKAMREFGTCGKIVYYKGKPIAYAQYAPSAHFPNITAYESKSVGKLEEGTIFLSCLFITDKKMRQRGLGEALLKNIVEDMRKREFKAIETFASRGSANNPSGPMKFYIKNGFVVKDNTNEQFPLMKLYL